MMPVGTNDVRVDKRKRILNASLEEFVERGFDGASTNAIANRAGVAKGLLFHYFRSKQGLYLALLDQAVRRLTEQLYRGEKSPRAPADLIEKMVAWSAHKLHTFQANPRLYEFVTAAFAKPPDVLRDKIESKRNNLEQESWCRFLSGLDTSRLRSDVSTEQAIEIVKIFVSGLETKYMTQLAALPEMRIGELEQMVVEMRRYLLVLRDGLYSDDKK